MLDDSQISYTIGLAADRTTFYMNRLAYEQMFFPKIQVLNIYFLWHNRSAICTRKARVPGGCCVIPRSAGLFRIRSTMMPVVSADLIRIRIQTRKNRGGLLVRSSSPNPSSRTFSTRRNPPFPTRKFGVPANVRSFWKRVWGETLYKEVPPNLTSLNAPWYQGLPRKKLSMSDS